MSLWVDVNSASSNFQMCSTISVSSRSEFDCLVIVSNICFSILYQICSSSTNWKEKYISALPRPLLSAIRRIQSLINARLRCSFCVNPLKRPPVGSGMSLALLNMSLFSLGLKSRLESLPLLLLDILLLVCSMLLPYLFYLLYFRYFFGFCCILLLASHWQLMLGDVRWSS